MEAADAGRAAAPRRAAARRQGRAVRDLRRPRAARRDRQREQRGAGLVRRSRARRTPSTPRRTSAADAGRRSRRSTAGSAGRGSPATASGCHGGDRQVRPPGHQLEHGPGLAGDEPSLGGVDRDRQPARSRSATARSHGARRRRAARRAATTWTSRAPQRPAVATAPSRTRCGRVRPGRASLALAGSPSLRLTTTTGAAGPRRPPPAWCEREAGPAAAAQPRPARPAPARSASAERRQGGPCGAGGAASAGAVVEPGEQRRARAGPRPRRDGHRRGADRSRQAALRRGTASRGAPGPRASRDEASPASQRPRRTQTGRSAACPSRVGVMSVPMPRPCDDGERPGERRTSRCTSRQARCGNRERSRLVSTTTTIRSSASGAEPEPQRLVGRADAARAPATSGCRRRCRRPRW